MKKIIYSLSVCMALGFSARAADLPCATPESQGVSSTAVLNWVKAMSQMDSVHSFVLVRHGYVIAQGAWAPYDLNRPHQLYSHSKSFTSTAIGFLVDDKKLDIDCPLIDIFPEKFPVDADPKVKALRVRDLLTMNTGFADSDNMRKHPEEPDWLKSFFATKPGVAPGTRYRYDTCATYVLAAVVEKISGKPMMDFLQERLCRPLDFGTIYTHVSPTGVALGGYGIYARTPDLAKFGLLYLNEGDWNGQRILSRDWVRLATMKHTKSGFPPADEPVTDWTSGYGFQFWRCLHNAYRADGSHGQFTVVMPDQDAVLSVTACLSAMPPFLTCLWEMLLPEMKNYALLSDVVAQKKLEKHLKKLALPVVAGAKSGAAPLPTEPLTFTENQRGYQSVCFEQTKTGLVCRLVIDKQGEQKFPVGLGKWKDGALWVTERDKKFEGMGDLLGEQPIATSGAWTKPDTFSLRTLFLDQAHRLELSFTRTNDTWKISGYHVGLAGCPLSN